MKYAALALVLAAGSMSPGEGQIPEPVPSSTFGWRRDGTGLYPDSKPPVEWSMLSRTMLGLKCQARKPKGADAGAAVSAAKGYLLQWLILGPLDAADETKSLSEPALPGEGEVQPDEGQKVGNAAWTALACEDTLLNLMGHFVEMKNKTAYAHTYLHSATGGTFMLQPEHTRGLKLWLNGKEIYAQTQTNLGSRKVLKAEMAQGWNRLLVRLTPVSKQSESEFRPECYLRLKIWSGKTGDSYEQKNILWITPLPNRCASNPIVVGDRIFLGSAPFDLLCLDKKTGRILWIRSNSYADAATDQERKDHAAVFQKIAPLVKRREEINQSCIAGTVSEKDLEQKDGLDSEITKLMGEVSREKYPMLHEWQDGAFFSGPTPVSDGKMVYAWLSHGVTVCYDLDGNRKWIRCDNKGQQEHGYWGSPVLAAGKVIVWMKEAMAFDAKTGQPAWRLEVPHGNWYGSMVTTRIKAVEAVVLNNGAVVRAADGVLITAGAGWHWAATPMVADGMINLVDNDSNHYRLRLPESLDKPVKEPSTTYSGLWPKELYEPGWPAFLARYNVPSQLCSDGLSYTVAGSGILTVMDLKASAEGKPAMVYQKRLPTDSWGIYQPYPYTAGICTSPTMAGGHIYLAGNTGLTLVLLAGREFKIVARNKIECPIGTERKSPWNYIFNYWPDHLQGTISSPVFENNRLYLRGEKYLYCIGEK